MQAVDQEVDRHLELLRKRIRDRGFSQAEVQDRLGWSRSYLSQLFSKRTAIRVDQVQLVLHVIRVPAAEFYGELYGWPAGIVAAASQATARKKPQEFGPFEWAEAELDRLLHLLRQRIMARGMPYAEIGKRLGWGRGVLQRLLTRSKRLRIEHVLAILHAIGVEPQDFFAELVLPEEQVELLRAGEMEKLDLVRAMRELRSLYLGLVEVLESRRVVEAGEIAAAAAAAAERAGERTPPRG